MILSIDAMAFAKMGSILTFSIMARSLTYRDVVVAVGEVSCCCCHNSNWNPRHPPPVSHVAYCQVRVMVQRMGAAGRSMIDDADRDVGGHLALQLIVKVMATPIHLRHGTMGWSAMAELADAAAAAAGAGATTMMTLA
jgi:hypothetical protein